MYRVTSGDYLLAFLQGVKEALTLRQRQSITIVGTIKS